MKVSPVPMEVTYGSVNHNNAQSTPGSWAAQGTLPCSQDLTLRLGGVRAEPGPYATKPRLPASPADSTVTEQILAQLCGGCDSGKSFTHQPQLLPVK